MKLIFFLSHLLHLDEKETQEVQMLREQTLHKL